MPRRALSSPQPRWYSPRHLGLASLNVSLEFSSPRLPARSPFRKSGSGPATVSLPTGPDLFVTAAGVTGRQTPTSGVRTLAASSARRDDRNLPTPAASGRPVANATDEAGAGVARAGHGHCSAVYGGGIAQPRTGGDCDHHANLLTERSVELAQMATVPLSHDAPKESGRRDALATTLGPHRHCARRGSVVPSSGRRYRRGHREDGTVGSWNRALKGGVPKREDAAVQ